MKKSTKGLVAAGAAATLLLGGAGTLAYWTAEQNVDGGTLNAGNIAMSAPVCTAWKHTIGDAPVTEIVPGDNVYKDCATTLTLEGDNIAATLVIDPATFGPDAATALESELTPTVQLLNASDTVISSVTAKGDTAVTARITVDFPYGTVVDNDSKNGTAALDSLKLVATQTNTNMVAP